MSRQETLSITDLQRMCAESEYLEESDIHMNDKTLSWDGNIIYYENKKPAATGNEYIIPIQVKGKEYSKLPRTDFIAYPVKTRDLNNYLKNGGVIFFVDAIEITGFKNRMYAKILLPVDLIKLMEGKEKQDSITIHLKHIGTIRELENLCILFNRNRPKQAMISIGTPIPDYKSVANFKVSTLPSKYTNPAVAIVKNSPVYLYIQKDRVDIPVLFTKIITSTEGKILIKIDNEINQKYFVQHIHMSSQTIMRISEVIEIVYAEEKHKIHIRCLDCSDINFNSAYEAAKIIIAVSEAKEVSFDSLNVGKSILEEIKYSFPKKFLDYHRRIIKMGKTLEKLEFNKSLFKTKEILDAESELYFLKLGLLDTKILPLPFDTMKDCGIYRHVIGSKKILIEYEKVQEKGYIIRKYLEEGKSKSVSQKYPDGHERCINKWFYLRGEDISEIIFDENKLLKEMKTIDEEETEQLLFLVFDCLKVYDKGKSERILSLAEKLFEILKEFLDDTLLEINKFQIIARRRKLSDEEKKILMPFKYSTNISARCCACVLLGQYDEFDIHVQQLSEEEKEEFYNWPIASFLPSKEKAK